MNLYVRLLLPIILLILAFSSGFYVRHLAAERHNAEVTATTLREDNAQLTQFAKDLKTLADRNQELRTELYDVDREHTRALTEKLADNDRLRGDLATAQRMRLKGATCPAIAAVGDPQAGSVGDGVPVDLGIETRFAVWDLRASAIKDAETIAYFQDYASKIKCPTAEKEKPR